MDERIKAIVELLECDSVEGAVRVVERHPSLLDPRADDILETYQQRCEEDNGENDEWEQAQRCRQFLSRCREVGLEQMRMEAEMLDLQDLEEQCEQDPSRVSELIAASEQFLTRWPEAEDLRAPVLHGLAHIYIGLAGSPTVESLIARLGSGPARAPAPAGQGAACWRRAIACLEEVLRYTQVEVTPDEYGQALHDLGTAYLYCLDAPRAAHLERAIGCLQQALGLRDRRAAPDAFMHTRLLLGIAHHWAESGDRQRHLAQAAACFEDVLACSGDELLNVHLQLGQIYADLHLGQREENLERALHHLAQALRVLPQEGAAPIRAILHFRIGAAHLEMPAADRRDHVEQAIAHLRESLALSPAQEVPLQHALYRICLGEALADRPDRRPAHLEEAALHAREALHLAAGDDAAELRGLAQRLLGRVSLMRIDPLQPETLRTAATTLQEALRQLQPGTAEHAHVQRQAALPGYLISIAQQMSGVQGIAQALAAAESQGEDQAKAGDGSLLRLARALRKYLQGDPAAGWSGGIAAARDALRHPPPDATQWGVASTLHDLGTLGLLLAEADENPVERAQHLDDAIDCLTDALSVRTEAAGPQAYAETQRWLGEAYAARAASQPAELPRAIAALREALRFQTAERAPQEYAAIQHRLGLAYLALAGGDRAASLGQAITCLREALRACGEAEASFRRARINLALATAYTELPGADRQANLWAAIMCLEQALPALRLTDQPSNDAPERTGPAGTFVQQGLRTMAYAREIIDRSLAYADAQLRLGTCLRQVAGPHDPGHLRRIIACHEEALRIYTPEKHPQEYARVRLALGEVYHGLPGEDRHATLLRARACYEEALRYLDAQAHPALVTRARASLGTLLCELLGPDPARVERAIAWNEEALRGCDPRTDASGHVLFQARLGQLFEQLPRDRELNLRRAITCYRQALSACDPLDLAQNQCYLGRALLRLGEITRSAEETRACQEQAITCFKQAAQHLTPERAPLPCRDAHLHLGHLAFTRGDDRQAFAAYTVAIAAGERLFQASLYAATRGAELAENAVLYQQAAFAATRLGEEEQALMILERGKTRLLTEALRLRTQRPAGVPDTIWMAFESAARRLRDVEALALPGHLHRSEAYAAEVPEASAALDAAVAMVRRSAPRFLQALAPAVLRALVPDERAALISVCFTSRGSVGFVVTRDETRTVAVPGFSTAVLEELIHGAPMGWRAALAHPAPDAADAPMEALLERLGRTLVGPLLEALPAGIERITFLPALEAFLLPLHAATLPSGERVLDRYQVGYAPSAEVLQRLPRREPAEPSLYAAVNPAEDPRLALAPAEGEAIAALFRERTVDSGRQATRERVRAGVAGRTHVHFICHGYFAEAAPPESGLSLGQGERLTLADLLDRQLDLGATRLVALSACSTGLIDVSRRSALEYVGLPAGFLLSGAPCVVCALWPVPDLPSAMLLSRFYEHHLAGQMDPVAALCAAQRWLRAQTAAEILAYVERQGQRAPHATQAVLLGYRLAYQHKARRDPDARPFQHPFYWAGFIAQGQ